MRGRHRNGRDLSVAGSHIGNLCHRGGSQRPDGGQRQIFALGQEQGIVLVAGVSILPAGQGVAGPDDGRGQGEGLVRLPHALDLSKVQSPVVQPLIDDLIRHGAAVGGEDDHDLAGQIAQIGLGQSGRQGVVLRLGGQDGQLSLPFAGAVGEGPRAQRGQRGGKRKLGDGGSLGKGAGGDSHNGGLAVDVIRPHRGDGRQVAGIADIVLVQAGQHIAGLRIFCREFVVLGGDDKDLALEDLVFQLEHQGDYGVFPFGILALEGHGKAFRRLDAEHAVRAVQLQGGGIGLPVRKGDGFLGQPLKGAKIKGGVKAMMDFGIDHAAVDRAQDRVGGPGRDLVIRSGEDVVGVRGDGAGAIAVQDGGPFIVGDQAGRIVGRGGHRAEVQRVLNADGRLRGVLRGHGLGGLIDVKVKTGDPAHEGSGGGHHDRTEVLNIAHDPVVGSDHAADHGHRGALSPGDRGGVPGRGNLSVVDSGQAAQSGGAGQSAGKILAVGQRSAVLSDQTAYRVIPGHSEAGSGNVGHRAVVDAHDAADHAGAGQDTVAHADVFDGPVILGGQQGHGVFTGYAGGRKFQVLHPAFPGDPAEQPQVVLPGLGQTGDLRGRVICLQSGQRAGKTGVLVPDGGHGDPGQVNVRDNM